MRPEVRPGSRTSDRCRVSSALASLATLASLASIAAGCTCGDGPTPSRDAGPVDADSSMVSIDADMTRDAEMDAFTPPDAGPPPMRGTCETCESDEECGASAYCVDLTVGGRACVPTCVADLPICPRAFACLLDVASGAEETVCLPVGGACCVDEDGDGYGSGVGCMGADCDDTNPEIHPGADEICDTIDDDCDGEIDDPPTDCVAGRCEMEPDGSYASTTSGVCVDGDCTDGVVMNCGLFVCDAEGVLCATTCAPTGVDDDELCRAGAHCTGGTCIEDFPDGDPCARDGECAIDRCENGFCCGSGTCCGVTADCPTVGGVGLACDDATMCQGTRGEVNCELSECIVTAGLPDDRACTVTTRALDCGLFLPIFCTGEVDQTPPSCPTGCTADTECVAGAHCEGGTCVDDRGPGGMCARTGECASDLSCVDGVCCMSDCTGACESCRVAGSEGTCTPVPAGLDPDAECAGFACSGYYVGFGATPECRHRTDVGDMIASCDGAGACLAPAMLCPLQPPAALQVACDASCEAPRGGTCVDTIAGICDDLDDPSDTVSCGVGACMRTVQRCVSGLPQTCSAGSVVPETCNAVDDDCDMSTDEGPSFAVCPPPAFVITTACSAGACGISTCADDRGDCDGMYDTGCETSLTTLTNCGACGNGCMSRPNASAACTSGACGIVCNTGYGDCNGVDTDGCEIDTRSTVDHCGGCGTVCPTRANAASTCAGSACGFTCNTGYGDCNGSAGDGCEIDTRTAIAHCGACGNSCTSRPNSTTTCASGTCGFTCNPGWQDCNGAASDGCEVDTQTSTTSCGACGTVCPARANATTSCSAGVCAFTCLAGYADCDGVASNGCEVNTQTSPTNCSACGVTCPARANATTSCSGGTCGFTCLAGYADCDGMASNGCEVNTLTSLTSCGSCGNVCATPANGSPSCSSGTCGIGSCNAGYANCDGNSANGCEVNTQTSISHCGTCGTSCPTPANASAGCAAGVCGIGTCNANYADCDGAAGNGCEVNTQTSASHCGGCGMACPALPNATTGCSSGSCGIVSCNPGWANCDGIVANGCEVNTLTSPSSCGVCGNMCSAANGSATCSAGTCVVSSCNPGYANCDGVYGNGCEVNTQTTVTSCGGCGNVCSLANATPACVSGSCQVSTCNGGYGNCDGAAANGCETNLGISTSHCGMCGNFCNVPNATESCSAGTCSISSCTAPFANCDGLYGNGCEANTQTSVSHCGACGSVCALANATPVCSAATCQIGSCNAGWYNVDGVTSNGCECQEDTWSQVCSSPSSVGSIAVGGAAITRSGKVVAGAGDWFTVSFPPASPLNGGGTPQISFTTNDGSVYRFEVYSSCSTLLGCGSGGSATNLTNWSMSDTAPLPPGGTAYLNRLTAWPSTVLVRVYRIASGTPCGNYTIRFAR